MGSFTHVKYCRIVLVGVVWSLLQQTAVAQTTITPIPSWTEVVRTKVGWALVRVIETRPATPRPLAEVEPQVRNAVRLKRDRATEAEILAGLRAAAKVSVDIVW